MKRLSIIFLILGNWLFASAQQISIPRIDQMPNKPTPYQMRDWKQVAIDYDNFIFDVTKSGTYLPLIQISQQSGTNYPDVLHILLDTYVGQNGHGKTAEAINILPAIVGASLNGVDKTTHFNTNWVKKAKDFFNLKNGQNVYLNGYAANTGSDWWYEIMPSVFFYQLYDFYPNSDDDFASQFVAIADRQLSVLSGLGGKLQPWTVPYFNYRAYNLLTGVPNTSSVPEPESAGSIAWLMYQAYVQTHNIKYLQGAELALDFLQNWGKNPSYEIQLPYGIVTAARMNAVEGTNYDIQKFLNWTFSSGIGTLRGWGTIVGNWNGYDASGLIGEANDDGNDYAFVMNGFQHAAALAPVAKYDKRFSRAIAKWILNLANASRLFYANALPDANQQASSNIWSKQNDPKACIPFESMKQNRNNLSPLVTGDAVNGGWAATNLSLYSGSGVGYLASLITTTNVEGILQIDLNKTDFRGDKLYPAFLYYNPYPTEQQVDIQLPAGTFDIYDAISESVLKTNVSGKVSFPIDADAVRQLIIIPPDQAKQTVGRFRKIFGGGIIDYHFANNYSNPLRIKAFTSDVSRTVSPGTVAFNCIIENNDGTETYKWFQNGVLINGANLSNLQWSAPQTSGVYKIRCEITANYKTVVSNDIEITVAPPGETLPSIENFILNGSDPYPINDSVSISSQITPANATVSWSCSGGSFRKTEGGNAVWTLPVVPGIYTIKLKVENLLGTADVSKTVLVKDVSTSYIEQNFIGYYPFNGDTHNFAQDAFHSINHNAVPVPDSRGNVNNAYNFSSAGQYISIPNDPALNFKDKLTVSLWVKPDNLPNNEQFVISHGSYEERYKMSIIPEKKMRWTIKTTGGIVDVDDKTILETGKFVHFTGVYTGYSVELYRNGLLAAYKALTGDIGNSTKAITLGRKDESETNYTFSGTVDELRIIDADLPVKYIKKLPEMWDLKSDVLQTSILRYSISPNPFTSDFMLQIPLGMACSAEIYTLQGQKLWHQDGLTGNARMNPNIPTGIYFLKIRNDLGIEITEKIIRL